MASSDSTHSGSVWTIKTGRFKGHGSDRIYDLPEVSGPAVDEPVEVVPLSAVAAFLGDPRHPDWADYVATNLLDALGQVPDTGDWHGALRSWCEQHMTGKLRPNRG